MSSRRVKKWSYSIAELLKDPAGREQFEKFLEREFSRENLKYAFAFSFSLCTNANATILVKYTVYFLVRSFALTSRCPPGRGRLSSCPAA